MANFGTYQGHQILSNAMSNTVKTVQDAFDDRTQRRQFTKTFDQNKLEQDRRFNQHVREENRQFDQKVIEEDRRFGQHKTEQDRRFGQHKLEQDRRFGQDKLEEDRQFGQKVRWEEPVIDQRWLNFEKDKDAWDSTQAAENYTTDMYGLSEESMVLDDNGTMTVNPKFQQIVENYDEITSLESIIQASDGKLNYADAVIVQNNLTDKYKQGFLNVRKQFVNMSEDDIDEWFKLPENEAFGKWYDKFLIDAGTPRGTLGYGEHMTTGEPESDEDEFEFTIPGYGSDDYKTVYGDKDGWGGGIQFKGPNGATDTQQKEANQLLEAIKNSKNNETDFDKSDTIMVTQEGNSFRIEENDSWLWGNESWQGRIENGKAQIYVNGQWISLSNFDKWESAGY